MLICGRLIGVTGVEGDGGQVGAEVDGVEDEMDVVREMMQRVELVHLLE
jgi:hypothetical protein